MKFADLCKLVPDTQNMHLICDGLEIYGQAEALSCLVNHEVDECTVTNIEAEDDTLKVWVENK